MGWFGSLLDFIEVSFRAWLAMALSIAVVFLASSGVTSLAAMVLRRRNGSAQSMATTVKVMFGFQAIAPAGLAVWYGLTAHPSWNVLQWIVAVIGYYLVAIVIFAFFAGETLRSNGKPSPQVGVLIVAAVALLLGGARSSLPWAGNASYLRGAYGQICSVIPWLPGHDKVGYELKDYNNVKLKAISDLRAEARARLDTLSESTDGTSQLASMREIMISMQERIVSELEKIQPVAPEIAVLHARRVEIDKQALEAMRACSRGIEEGDARTGQRLEESLAQIKKANEEWNTDLSALAKQHGLEMESAQ